MVCADKSTEPPRRGDRQGQIGDHGPAHVCDVADPDAVAEMADAAQAWFGRPADVVVNNADRRRRMVIGEMPLICGARRSTSTCGRHPRSCRGCVRIAGRGGIINVGSWLPARGRAEDVIFAYNVSKAAVPCCRRPLPRNSAGRGVADGAVSDVRHTTSSTRTPSTTEPQPGGDCDEMDRRQRGIGRRPR